MEEQPDFNICRLCLEPRTSKPLTSLYDEGLILFQIIEATTGVKYSENANRFNALICETCLIAIESAYDLGEIFRNSDKYFLQRSDPEIAESFEETVDVSNVSLIVPPLTREVSILDGTDEPQSSNTTSLVDQNANSNEVHENIERFSCEFCSFGSYGKHLLRQHLESHKVYQCESCDKVFKNKYLLHRHIEGVHLKIKRFHCKYCSYSSYHKKNLLLHMERLHK